jgi:hypothetical protein
VYHLPDGDSTFIISIKTLSDKFYPDLYFKYYEDLDSEMSKLEFPPGGTGFSFLRNWDRNMKELTYE